ncbi:hypothetical protein QTP88_024124 [Uroleucon formosanum]
MNDVFIHNNSLNDTPKPHPPIFVRRVIDYTEVCTKPIDLIGVDHFFCKSSADRLKIQTANPDSYRTLVRYLKEENVEFHTYQLREDKSIRVVIQNLHPTTQTELIKEELEVRLFEVRHVTNVLHGITKIQLPLFFVDLEPTPKSSEIFQLSSLLHTKVKIEELYKPKSISQCNNSQEYGHTKTYCGYPSRCVRCGAHHQSVTCPNSRDDPPKCALCSGDHPASCKGCSVDRELQRGRKPTTNNYFNTINNNFIVGGDNNAKHLAWRCRVNNPRGIVHQNFISTKNYKILAPPGPTYWPSSARKNPDILDIYVTKIPSNLNRNTENLLELNSDHSSILLIISASPLTRLESPKLFKPTTDENKFHDLVNQQINLNVKLKSTDDIDLAENNFTKFIQSAAWSSISKSQTSFHNHLLSEYIRCIIVEKRRARANFQRTRLPSHKHKYNKLTNHLKKVLAKHKSETFINFLSKLSPKDSSLWRATKNICKFKTSNLPIKNPDGSYVISDSDKAELFKVHLFGIFQPHPDIYSQTNTSVVEDFLNSLPYLPSNPIKHFTPNDIKFAINKYSFKKSPGFDLITAEVARCLPKKSLYHLSHIINSIIRLSYFPMLWKFSIIILVPKPNKPPDSITSF